MNRDYLLSRPFIEALGLCLLALVLAGAAGWFREPPDRAPVSDGDMTVDQALKLGDSVLWIDARQRKAFEQQHVPGASLLNEDEWEDLLGELLQAWTPGRIVIVYCDSRTCGAARSVARRLREEVGLTDVRVLAGGWQAWLEQHR